MYQKPNLLKKNSFIQPFSPLTFLPKISTSTSISCNIPRGRTVTQVYNYNLIKTIVFEAIGFDGVAGNYVFALVRTKYAEKVNIQNN